MTRPSSMPAVAVILASRPALSVEIALGSKSVATRRGPGPRFPGARSRCRSRCRRCSWHSVRRQSWLRLLVLLDRRGIDQFFLRPDPRPGDGPPDIADLDVPRGRGLVEIDVGGGRAAGRRAGLARQDAAAARQDDVAAVRLGRLGDHQAFQVDHRAADARAVDRRQEHRAGARVAGRGRWPRPRRRRPFASGTMKSTRSKSPPVPGAMRI